MTMRCGARVGMAAALVVAAAGIAPAGDPLAGDPLAGLAFLAGSWCSADGATEEQWMAPRGGLMLGLNRTVGENGRASFEYLRIEQRDGVPFYVASPGGRPPTEFRLAEAGERRAVFENPEHDFPQRIRYELDAEGALRAGIEGVVDGETRGASWTWTRCAPR